MTLEALMQESAAKKLCLEEEEVRTREAHGQCMKALSQELDQVRSKARAVAAASYSRAKVQP